jgi:hypothetical protein
MGVALFVVGVFGFVAAAVVSKRAYAPAQRTASGTSPEPGTGDAPGWMPAVYIGFLVLAIIGLLLIIFG